MYWLSQEVPGFQGSQIFHVCYFSHVFIEVVTQDLSHFQGYMAPIIFFFFQFWHDSFFIFICLFHSDVTGPSTTDDHNDVTTSSKTGDNNVVGSSTNDVTDLSNDVASGNITDVTEKGDVKSPGTKQWSSEQNSVVENFWKKI